MKTCSFCGKRKDQVRVLLEKPEGPAVCSECVAKMRAGGGFVAYCSSCTPARGRHAVECPEWSIA